MPHTHGLSTLGTGGMGDLHSGLELPMQERHPHLQYDNVLVHADAMDGLPAGVCARTQCV